MLRNVRSYVFLHEPIVMSSCEEKADNRPQGVTYDCDGFPLKCLHYSANQYDDITHLVKHSRWEMRREAMAGVVNSKELIIW